MQTFSDAEIYAKAVELGVIDADQQVPRHKRSRVVAALVEERRAQTPREQAPDPQLAKEIVIRGGEILIDGEPFPWLVSKEPMEIGLDPDNVSTVRLTLLAKSVQIIRPEPREESEQQ